MLRYKITNVVYCLTQPKRQKVNAQKQEQIGQLEDSSEHQKRTVYIQKTQINDCLKAYISGGS
jgi:hypothetical protein